MVIDSLQNKTSALNTFFCGAFIFVGLSAANAVGGFYQLALMVTLILTILYYRPKFPKLITGLTISSGILIATFSIQNQLDLYFFVTTFIRSIRPLIEGFGIGTIAIYIFKVTSSNKLTKVFFIYVLIMIIFMILMVVQPIIKMSWINYWYSGAEYSDIAKRTLTFRGWGVSKHHLYGLPLACGTIFIFFMLSLINAHSFKNKFVLYLGAFFSLVLILPNARIGLVPPCLFVFFSLFIFLNKRGIKSLFTLMALSILLLSAVILFFQSDIVPKF